MENVQPGPMGGAARRILEALGEGELTVNEIARATGLSQPNVSNHLARLRCRGWVVSRRHGRQISYSRSRPPLISGEATPRSHLTPFSRAEQRPALPALAAEYLAALLQLDEPRALDLVEAALAHGFHWKAISRRVLEPALAQVGELWAAGELSVAEEHAATAMTARLQERLAARIPRPARPVGSAVVAGVTGNQHTLGGRVVADYLADAGWETHYLGSDLPVDDLLAVVHRLRPDAVLLSAAMPEHLPALREAMARLRVWRRDQDPDERLPLLVAGGQYLATGAPSELGVDLQGTDPEAIAAEMTERLAAIHASRRSEHDDANDTM